MTQQIVTPPWDSDTKGIAFEGGLSGLAGKVLGVKDDETGLEFVDNSGGGGITDVTGQVPVVVTGTTTKVVSLGGLDGYGNEDQVITSTGNGLEYRDPEHRIYAPLVNGDLPGPGFIAGSEGQCIMVRVQ